MGFASGFEHIVRENEPLAPYTWFRVGGPAEFFAEPTSVQELAALVRRCREQEVPVRVLGGGSNLLVRDQGVRGLVLHLAAPAFCDIQVDGSRLFAGGGAKLGHVISTAVREGLAGLETLVGIPGTVGGALRGNADAGGVDVGQWTDRAQVMNRAGDVVLHERNQLRFSYRHSSLDELVILSAQFVLSPGDPRELTKRMQKVWIVKKSQEPPGHQSCGYVFKDVGGMSAASLVEQAGLKASRVGQAAVCEYNANRIVAQPGATSEDILGLIELLRNGVGERLNVDLETQIQLW